MTQLATAPAPTAARRWLTVPPAWVMAVVSVLVAAAAYVLWFGACESESGFCYVGVAGTRSEVVVTWLDGDFDVYTQTYPGE